MLIPALLSEISSHDLEVAETLIGVLRFVLIFVAARTLAEILVRFELPTILGELKRSYKKNLVPTSFVSLKLHG